MTITQHPPETYKIIFFGKLVPGFTRSQVEQNLKQTLRLNDQQLARLFSGNPCTVKKDLPRDTAIGHQKKFASLGAEVKLIVQEVAPPMKNPGLSLVAIEKSHTAQPSESGDAADADADETNKKDFHFFINLSCIFPLLLIALGILLILAYSPLPSAALKNGFVVGLLVLAYGSYKFKIAKGSY